MFVDSVASLSVSNSSACPQTRASHSNPFTHLEENPQSSHLWINRLGISPEPLTQDDLDQPKFPDPLTHSSEIRLLIPDRLT